MIKKILSLAFVGACAAFASAQNPLPLDPNVKHGTLDNGLNYYILHNEEPKERANFYIAQKVGSTLEAPEQLGLAHFLEHMAFNGTEHYPGKNMLNYLQSKGIRFGADINAYTSFDETVYNINNVPTTDKALMDSVLLCLYDWSGSILLEEDEINAERGVIEEEWRSRNSGQYRMMAAVIPQVFDEYQYEQMPIGKMEIVRNFPPQALRDYYKKWYRPDQQGIIIVGDFDADEMEAKVKEMFSKIPMPENAAPREYPTVSDNKEPIYVFFSDKEYPFNLILVSFKSDKLPFEMRNTDLGFIQTEVMQEIFAQMINNRLQDYSKKPECKYQDAEVAFGNFYVAATKDAFDIQIIAKDDVEGAYKDAMAIVAQACKTGFTASELTRARDILIASFEKAYNERNNTKNATLASKLCRTFIENAPNPGAETAYNLAKQLTDMIPVDAYNQIGAQLLTDENQVVVIAVPEKEGMKVITKEEGVGILHDALSATYEPFVDEVITDPLIENLPTPGAITSTAEGEFGTTVYTLSNGVKVIVKPTDFQADEILLTAYKEGGKDSYPAEVANYVVLADDAYDASKLGNFDQVKLGKYLAGKNASLSYSIGNTVVSLDGKSSVKDLPTFMELVYSSFAQLNPDAEAYATEMEKSKNQLKMMDKNPAFVFQKHWNDARYGNNPMFAFPSMELIDGGDYDKEFALVKESLSNGADYTFIITGNVDQEKLKPYLEQYIATIPSTGKKSDVKKVTSISTVDGVVTDAFNFPMQAPKTQVFVDCSGSNIPYSIENSVKVSLVGELLDNVFTDTLREEEGGTYSPYATSMLSPYTGKWEVLYLFETNDQVQEKLIKRAEEEFLKLLANGTDEVQFNKVKEAAMKQYEIQVRTNKYWNNNLLKAERGINDITNHKAAIENLTLAEMNNFMKTLYDGKNKIEVVMTGVQE